MKYRIWAARSNSEFESWAIQDVAGKMIVVKDLEVRVKVTYPKQELESTPRAWTEAEGHLRFTGNGSAVIE